jgi:hypothetical protein
MVEVNTETWEPSNQTINSLIQDIKEAGKSSFAAVILHASRGAYCKAWLHTRHASKLTSLMKVRNVEPSCHAELAYHV